MVKEKLENLKTSELLDRIAKADTDETIEPLDEEIDNRLPFKYNEERFTEHNQRLDDLEEEIKELRTQLKNHDHKDNEVVVKL